MAGSLNKVQIIGNLGQDPDIRYTQAGDKIANISIATSDQWKDKQTGERRERTEWHRVVIFNAGLADVVEQYLRKGSKVYIEGKLQTRKWQDQQGQDRYTTEVVLQAFNGQLIMLGGTQNTGQPQNQGAGFSSQEYAQQSGGRPPQQQGMDYGQGGGGAGDLDDDIPF